MFAAFPCPALWPDPGNRRSVSRACSGVCSGVSVGRPCFEKLSEGSRPGFEGPSNTGVPFPKGKGYEGERGCPETGRCPKTGRIPGRAGRPQGIEAQNGSPPHRPDPGDRGLTGAPGLGIGLTGVSLCLRVPHALREGTLVEQVAANGSTWNIASGSLATRADPPVELPGILR